MEQRSEKSDFFLRILYTEAGERQRGIDHHMMTNAHLVHAFEREQIRRTPADYHTNLRIMEALYEEARLIGAWPPSDPLAGIEVDLRLARALNVRPTP